MYNWASWPVRGKRRMRWGGKRERERETEWDKIEARWADERWGCQASGRAAEADSDVVVAGRGREEVRRNNG